MVAPTSAIPLKGRGRALPAGGAKVANAVLRVVLAFRAMDAEHAEGALPRAQAGRAVDLLLFRFFGNAGTGGEAANGIKNVVLHGLNE